jgi:hypothetical protein
MIRGFEVPNCCFIMELFETQTFVINSLAFPAKTLINLSRKKIFCSATWKNIHLLFLCSIEYEKSTICNQHLDIFWRNFHTRCKYGKFFGQQPETKFSFFMSDPSNMKNPVF